MAKKERLIVSNQAKEQVVGERSPKRRLRLGLVGCGEAFYKNITENKTPKTGPADFVHDLELFAEMARLMFDP